MREKKTKLLNPFVSFVDHSLKLIKEKTNSLKNYGCIKVKVKV